MGLSGSVLYKVRGASSSAGKERETTGSGAETQSQVPDRGIYARNGVRVVVTGVRLFLVKIDNSTLVFFRPKRK